MQVIEKPWGKEELLERNDSYMVKRLTMRKGHRCSLQKHNFKRETIYILEGRLRILTGSGPEHLEETIYLPGMDITIGPGVAHRMEAVEHSVYLEASTPELEDVVRFSDDYARA